MCLSWTFSTVYHKITPFCGDPLFFPNASTVRSRTAHLYPTGIQPRGDTHFTPMATYTDAQRVHWAQCGPETNEVLNGIQHPERVSKSPHTALDPTLHPPRPAHATDSHRNRVFDLAVRTEPHGCGDSCDQAAMAIDAYHGMLADVSALRSWWLYAMLSRRLPEKGTKPADLSPHFCALPRQVAVRALTLHRKLESVLEMLRRAAPHLSVACVAPPRMPAIRDIGIGRNVRPAMAPRVRDILSERV